MPRRDLNDNTAWDDCREAVVYSKSNVAVAATPNKELGPLGLPFGLLLVTWGVLDAARLQAGDGIVQSNALVRLRDAETAVVVTNVHHDTLALVRQKRGDPLFVLLFPNTLSDILKRALAGVTAVAKVLLLKLGQPGTPKALSEANAAPLQVAINQAAGALDNRLQAVAIRDAGSQAVKQYKTDVNAALRLLESELSKFAVIHKKPPQWVNAFFLPPKPTKVKPAAV